MAQKDVSISCLPICQKGKKNYLKKKKGKEVQKKRLRGQGRFGYGENTKYSINIV